MLCVKSNLIGLVITKYHHAAKIVSTNLSMKVGTADLCHKRSAIPKAILRGVILAPPWRTQCQPVTRSCATCRAPEGERLFLAQGLFHGRRGSIPESTTDKWSIQNTFPGH